MCVRVRVYVYVCVCVCGRTGAIRAVCAALVQSTSRAQIAWASEEYPVRVRGVRASLGRGDGRSQLVTRTVEWQWEFINMMVITCVCVCVCVCVCAHTLVHSLTHSLTHSFIHVIAMLLVIRDTYYYCVETKIYKDGGGSLTHSLTHMITHYVISH